MPGWLATTILVLARVTALMLIVPGLSQRVVPWRARALMIVLMSIPVLCVIPVCEEGLVNVNSLPALLAHEVVVGISLGLVPAVIVWGMQVAVQAVHGMTGLLEGGELTDEGASNAPLQRLFLGIVLTVFFVSSGHRLVFEALLDSFHWLPAGSYTSLQSVHEVVVDLLTASFGLGVRSMSPIAASLAVGLMTLAAINRIVPQFEYFAVGMSVQTMVLLGSLVLSLGGVVWMLENSFLSMPESVGVAWQALLQNVEVQ